MKRAAGKKEQFNNALRYLMVLISAALILLFVLIFTNPVEGEYRKKGETLPVSETLVAELQNLEEREVGSVVAAIRQVQESREEVIRSSEAESRSVEESIRQSVAFRESSLARAEYESSVAESSREAERELLNAPLQGSHLVAGQVVYDCDDTDIPYLRKLFSHCVVIGNSRAKNAVDCGIMTENEVRFQSGQSVEQIADYAVSVANLYKPKTLFIMGLNDVAYYDRDYNRYRADYTAMINRYLQINPDSEIYCMESLPIPPEALSFFYRASTSLGDFNEAVRAMCEENGWHYVSASDYADFKYINSKDHAHYNKDFYFLWAQCMATEMHLWEDEAGLGYEVCFTEEEE